MNLSFPFFITFFLLIAFFAPDFLSTLKGLIPILLGLVMFGMGMTIEFKDIKKVIDNPKWLIVGTVLQLTIMPLLAYLLVNFFELSNELFLGFIILGSCPGGTASNVFCYLANANLPLSITLTITSTVLATILTPLWIFILAKQTIQVNFWSLVQSTFWIVLFPLIDGFVIRKILKNKLNNMLRFFPKFSEFSIALIIGIIFSINSKSLHEISLVLIIVILLHNILGFLLSFVVCSLLNFPKDVKKTITIEVGMQNSGLGMALSLFHFGKIVALPSVVFSLWHNVSAMILINIWKIKDKDT
ncbi:MAG: bile acid:sodium symporter family protein [Rickettsiales bacterium TMED254]|nr:hypothetical protein [Rickettsiales bacterium]RPF76893.1 MAG: bile acid:sodium symporter family protein [Rickettsiales bacterium TMED254]|tara:strand:+ start:68 stop:970 length:903 start_codon:yes stop_codon:yes gene_type:complete